MRPLENALHPSKRDADSYFPPFPSGNTLATFKSGALTLLRRGCSPDPSVLSACHVHTRPTLVVSCHYCMPILLVDKCTRDLNQSVVDGNVSTISIMRSMPDSLVQDQTQPKHTRVSLVSVESWTAGCLFLKSPSCRNSNLRLPPFTPMGLLSILKATPCNRWVVRKELATLSRGIRAPLATKETTSVALLGSNHCSFCDRHGLAVIHRQHCTCNPTARRSTQFRELGCFPSTCA